MAATTNAWRRGRRTTPGRTALDYRVGEYGSFLAAMLDRLASPAYPALGGLTVRTPDDPVIGLLDAWAVVGDLLTFHGERIADEAYLRTADGHRSLALLGRLVGHRPRPGWPPAPISPTRWTVIRGRRRSRC
ncbi:hypothetical protein ACFQ60_09425 [Streptomyces zhihengii]